MKTLEQLKGLASKCLDGRDFNRLAKFIPYNMICDWYFKDTPVLTMSFSLTEEDLRVTMERDVELSAVAGAVKNQHHKKKI